MSNARWSTEVARDAWGVFGSGSWEGREVLWLVPHNDPGATGWGAIEERIRELAAHDHLALPLGIATLPQGRAVAFPRIEGEAWRSRRQSRGALDALAGLHALGVGHGGDLGTHCVETASGMRVRCAGVCDLLRPAHVTRAMSPALVLGEQLDTRGSDVFAFACSWLDASGAAWPDAYATRRGLRRAAVDRVHAPAAQLCPRLGPAEAVVLDRARSARRPSNASVLRSALLPAVESDDEGEWEVEASLPEGPRVRAQRPPVGRVVAIVTLGLSLVVVAYALAQRAGVEPGRGSSWNFQHFDDAPALDSREPDRVRRWRAPTCRSDDRCGDGLRCLDGVCAPEGFVFVPPGRFESGSPPTEVGRQRLERRFPAVLQRGYYLQEHEVTRAQWRETMGTSPSMLTGCDACPVDSVNWYEALAYANARSDAAGLERCYELIGCQGDLGAGCEGETMGNAHGCSGAFTCREVVFRGYRCPGYRLPTEVEWERAARGETTTATWLGELADGEAGLPANADAFAAAERLNFASAVASDGWPCADLEPPRPDAGSCGPWPAKSGAPNPYGLYDMLGNVAEWTYDASHQHPDREVVDRALDGSADQTRVLRGGNWFHTWKSARAAYRTPTEPSIRFVDVGFRLARTAPSSRELREP